VRGGGGWKRAHGLASEALPEETGSQQIGGTYGAPRQSSTLHGGGHRKFLNPLGLNLTDFWDDTAPARHRKFKARWHVNELKPMIPSRCIELSTMPGDVIVDPFAGGGSTFEAAQLLGRQWIGSEIVDCDLIRDRFKRNLPDVSLTKPLALSQLLKEPNPELRIDTQRCPISLRNNHTMEQQNLFRDLASTNY